MDALAEQERLTAETYSDGAKVVFVLAMVMFRILHEITPSIVGYSEMAGLPSSGSKSGGRNDMLVSSTPSELVNSTCF